MLQNLLSAAVVIGTLRVKDPLTLCMLGKFSYFCCRLLTFFNYFSQKILSGTFQNVKRFGSRSRLSLIMLVLIWIQTVCKCHQQTIEVAASKERVRLHEMLMLIFSSNFKKQ